MNEFAQSAVTANIKDVIKHVTDMEASYGAYVAAGSDILSNLLRNSLRFA